jgi:cysteine desulfurase
VNIRAYLDNNATTKPDPLVVDAMLPYLTDQYLNPASTAGQILMDDDDPTERAKHSLAQLAGDRDLAKCFFLTSGASEANSWAVASVTATHQTGHLLATSVEHPSLLAALMAAQNETLELTLISVDRHGRVDETELLAAIRPDTRLVSVMLANNETGVIQPVASLAAEIRRRGLATLIHSDATQTFGRIPIGISDELIEVDMLSLSAHKFHGPKGIGALFVRDNVSIAPLIFGGQDGGARGGTANTAAAAGLAAAADQARLRLTEMERVATLRQDFEASIRRLRPDACINGAEVDRLPNTISVTVPGLDATAAVERLAMAGICAATGAACSSGAEKPSHVLLAMGLDYASALSTLRFSLSRETSEDELNYALVELGALIRLS